MRPSVAICLLSGIVGFAPACAAIWGFEDGIEGDDGGSVGSSSSSGLPSSSSGALDPDASTPVPDGCAEREAGAGLFVDGVNGSAEAPCTRELPCRTFQRAIDQISTADTTVYVRDATYNESIVVAGERLGLGIRIEGRWKVEGGAWLPSCEEKGGFTLAGVASRTVDVQAPAPPPEPELDAGADAEADASGPQPPNPAERPIDLVLAYATVRGADPNNASESSYALFINGGHVIVDGSVLLAGKGAPGLSPGQLPDATGQGSVTECGDGTNGSPGSAIALGSWTETGWTVATEPETTATNGDRGECGTLCGGANAGSAGKNGSAGGASIALYSWNASVRLERTALTSLGGGAGGNGAPGQVGATACGKRGGTGGYGSPAPGGPTACVAQFGVGGLASEFDNSTCTLPEAAAPGGTSNGLGAAAGPFEAVIRN